MRIVFCHLYKVQWFNLPAYFEALPMSIKKQAPLMSTWGGMSIRSGGTLLWESENLGFFCFLFF